MKYVVREIEWEVLEDSSSFICLMCKGRIRRARSVKVHHIIKRGVTVSERSCYIELVCFNFFIHSEYSIERIPTVPYSEFVMR
jgi:hypothetical protein